MITIIDYGMGNLGSISNMFKRIGVQSEITSDKKKIETAKKILLPGVGKKPQVWNEASGKFCQVMTFLRMNAKKSMNLWSFDRLLRSWLMDGQ